MAHRWQNTMPPASCIPAEGEGTKTTAVIAEFRLQLSRQLSACRWRQISRKEIRAAKSAWGHVMTKCWFASCRERWVLILLWTTRLAVCHALLTRRRNTFASLRYIAPTEPEIPLISRAVAAARPASHAVSQLKRHLSNPGRGGRVMYDLSPSVVVRHHRCCRTSQLSLNSKLHFSKLHKSVTRGKPPVVICALWLKGQ